MYFKKTEKHMSSYFESLTEFYKFMESHVYEMKTNFGGEYFGDYNRYKRYMYEVDQDLLNEYNSIKGIDTHLNQLKDKFLIKYRNDVVGVIPNVPNTVLGLPQSMINIQKKRIKTSSKILDIVLNINIDYRWEQKEITQRLVELLKLVDNLEQSGYRVNLYAGGQTAKFVCHMPREDQVFLIKLKSSNELLDTAKLMFPIVNRQFVKSMIVGYLAIRNFDEFSFNRTSTDKIVKELEQLKGVKAFGISFEYDTRDMEDLKRKVDEYNAIERQI